MRRVATAVVLLSLAGCGGGSAPVGGSSGGGGSCVAELRGGQRTYSGLERPWPGLEVDRGRRLRATEDCPTERTVDVFGIVGVPTDIAFTIGDPGSGIWVAEGSFFIQEAHPLRAAFFASERVPDHRRGRRCHRRRTRTARIVDLNLFGLAMGLDAPRASTVRIDRRTRFRGLGEPLARAREGQRVTVRLVKCPDSDKPVATLIRRAG